MGLYEEVELVLANRAVYVKYHAEYTKKSDRSPSTATPEDLAEEVAQYLYFDQEYSKWVAGATLGEAPSSVSGGFNVNQRTTAGITSPFCLVLKGVRGTPAWRRDTHAIFQTQHWNVFDPKMRPGPAVHSWCMNSRPKLVVPTPAPHAVASFYFQKCPTEDHVMWVEGLAEGFRGHECMGFYKFQLAKYAKPGSTAHDVRSK
jgi:hypothetical protein